MTFNIKSILKKIAKTEGVSPKKVREEMQKAIDMAWHSENEEEMRHQKRLFPSGKPTIEEFLRKAHGQAKED
jgi:hypothetical protein